MAGNYVTRFVRLRGRPDGAWLVHPDMRPRLVDFATSEGISMTDAIVKILCDKFGVTHDVTPRKTTPEPKADEINLRIPAALDTVLDRKARARRKTSVQDIIRQTLCEHFGLTVPSRNGSTP